jgi:signal transduction histidine kinase
MASFVSELERAAGEPVRQGRASNGRAAFLTLLDYIELTADDEARLARFAPRARKHFGEVVAHFYDKVMSCPETAAVITGGPAQVDRLRETMVQWLETGLSGPHDEGFHQARRRTGEVHVRIGLPQHLMVAAMSVIRIDLRRVVEQEYPEATAERAALIEALHRWLDLELGIMIEAYRAASEERFRRKARLAIVGQLAATITHDLRNPLSVLDSSLHILRKHAMSDERTARHVNRMSEQLRVCNGIISDLLEVARESTPRCDSIDVSALISDVLDVSDPPPGVRVDVEVDPGLRAFGDKGLLRQALVNLLGNAYIALGERGGLVRMVAREEGESLVIEVLDDGPGFPPAILPEVFEPLVTTRAKGTGLGLALVESVARRHGGTATATNGDAGGASVSLRLPRRGPPAPPDS